MISHIICHDNTKIILHNIYHDFHDNFMKKLNTTTRINYKCNLCNNEINKDLCSCCYLYALFFGLYVCRQVFSAPETLTEPIAKKSNIYHVLNDPDNDNISSYCHSIPYCPPHTMLVKSEQCNIYIYIYKLICLLMAVYSSVIHHINNGWVYIV